MTPRWVGVQTGLSAPNSSGGNVFVCARVNMRAGHPVCVHTRVRSLAFAPDRFRVCVGKGSRSLASLNPNHAMTVATCARPFLEHIS